MRQENGELRIGFSSSTQCAIYATPNGKFWALAMGWLMDAHETGRVLWIPQQQFVAQCSLFLVAWKWNCVSRAILTVSKCFANLCADPWPLSLPLPLSLCLCVCLPLSLSLSFLIWVGLFSCSCAFVSRGFPETEAVAP